MKIVYWTKKGSRQFPRIGGNEHVPGRSGGERLQSNSRHDQVRCDIVRLLPAAFESTSPIRPRSCCQIIRLFPELFRRCLPVAKTRSRLRSRF